MISGNFIIQFRQMECFFVRGVELLYTVFCTLYLNINSTVMYARVATTSRTLTKNNNDQMVTICSKNI